jgi:SNF2 family DNA or RNA helicase
VNGSVPETVEAITPWEFQQELLDQHADVDYVLWALEMGTGKTPLATWRDMRLREQRAEKGPSLWVAPLGTHESIAEHVTRLTGGGLSVERVDPKNRHALLDSKADMSIVHWEALRLMPELWKRRWGHIISDECQKMKGRKTQQTKAVKRIKGDHKTSMSGSPVTDYPGDMWSVLNYLYPSKYTSYWRFYEENVDYEMEYGPQGQQYRKVKGVTQHWLDYGLPQIKPFFARHMKKEQCCPHHPEGVMPWLPDKNYEKIVVDLSPQQRRAYREMEKDMLAWVGAQENIAMIAPAVISRMIRLQQFAIAYMDWSSELDKWVMSEPSTKLDALMEVLDDNPAESFVVFAQWKAPLALLAKRLQKKGITYTRFTGDETNAQRDINKAMFMNRKAQVMLMTISAGGVGVDGMQHVCNKVVFLDRLWSPKLNEQAEDRLWRGGQLRGVTVIDIMARSTVDAGREQRLILKNEWIRRMLGG